MSTHTEDSKNLEGLFDGIFDDDASESYDDGSIFEEESIIEEMTSTKTISIEVEDIEENIANEVETEIETLSNPLVQHINEVKESIQTYNKFSNKLDNLEFDSETDTYTLTEFDKMQIVYKIVRNPSNEITNYFSTHCRMINEDETFTSYETSNQLSKHYVLTSVEDLIDNYITKAFNIKEPFVQLDPFTCVWKGKTDKKLKVIDDNIIKDIFAICTGKSPDTVFNVRDTTIDMNIMNTYDGKKAISVTLSLSINIDIDGQKLVLNDYFTLSNSSLKYLHKGIQLTSLEEALSSIEQNFIEDIKILKTYKPTDADISSISMFMSKKKSKEYKNRWENIPSMYKNMYYNLLLLSSIVQEEYRAKEHINIQTSVNKLVKDIYKKYNKDNVKKTVV
jgi:hypothetical protein